jgi:cell division protein FtsI/penicillin-binding protein 2
MSAFFKNKQPLSFKRCHKDKDSATDCDWRINAVIFAFFGILALIFFRLYFLQVIDYSSFRALADNQHNIFKKLIPERGEIFLKDKDGLFPIALNREAKMAYAVPQEIDDPQKTSTEMADNLNLNREELLAKFSKEGDLYEVVKNRLSEAEVEKINSLNLKGIHLSDEIYRYYPSGELASQVVGFVGWEEEGLAGKYGVEASFEKRLGGEEGDIFQNRDSSGNWITVGERKITEAKNGESLILTLDHIVQYETEKILKSAVLQFEAESGSVIVMETMTGRILSMANYPTFNPNEYSQVESMDLYRNPAVSDAYECGSVFKPITMASALDSGRLTPETTYTDSGVVQEAGYSIRNSDLKAYGSQTMTEVLEKSLNTGAIFAEKSLGNKNFLEYLKRFGFGEGTGIELVGEGQGNISNLKNLKSSIEFFTASFGQGITVTPLQLITAYNALANGGILLKPQIVERVIYPNGSDEEILPEEVRRVISQKAALQISQMLRSVVVKGHGKRADVPGYLVAGKTGTAQVASSVKKGYADNQHIGSFAGFAPMNNPRFTILVRVNNPQTVDWAESSAAPVFGELMKFLLDYYNIEPTEEYTQASVDAFNATHKLRENLIKKEQEAEKLKNEQAKKSNN